MEAILLNSEQLIAKNGKEYTKASLGTNDGIITAYCWDDSLKDVDIYSCISLTISLKGEFYSVHNVARIFDIPSLLKYKPRLITKEYLSILKDKILSTIPLESNEKNCITNLFDTVLPFYNDKYAATKHHHAYKGGLLTHTIELVELYLCIYNTPMFAGTDPFVMVVSCLLHDYGKIKEYDNEGNITDNYFLFGHIYLSSRYAEEICHNFSINKSKVSNIVHCILSHHGRVEFGSPVAPATKEAFLVSKLDELSGFGFQFNMEGSDINYNGSRIKVLTLEDK